MTSMEFKIINQLRFYISNVAYPTPWLTSVSDSVLIRFIRARKGDAAAAWQMILGNA